MNLRDAKILVTGGAGFVGSFVVEHLLAGGAAGVVVLDNLFRGSRENLARAQAGGRVRLIEGDIRDRALVARAVDGCDACFHLAALRITHCAEAPAEAMEVMMNGTMNVLEACVAAGVPKAVLASSASVYGQAETFPTPETHHPYANTTLYGAAKLANELMFRSFGHMHGLRSNALRYFNIYGPRMDTTGQYTEVLVRWHRMIRDGERPRIFGDGRQTMDFVYVEDVARATVLALTTGAEGEVFNVAAGVETSLAELCALLLDVMKADIEPEFVPLPADRQKVEVMRRLADTTKAADILKFRAAVPLREGLNRLVEWLDRRDAGAPAA